MIQIGSEKYIIDSRYVDVIKDRMAKETCKTNLNPQLMFRQSFTGITSKTFVGNWLKHGFWISKYRVQLIQFRPDIIARFTFAGDSANSIVSVRYSIGFSSLFVGLILIATFTFPFLALGRTMYAIVVIISIIFYILFSAIAFENMKEKVVEKLLNNIMPET